jgi:putative nucleotidyltransferase with HDIG domain
MEEAVRTRENDNTRLLSDVQRHLRQELLLRDIDDAIKPIGSLDHTLETLLTRINSRLSIDASSIYIYDPDLQLLRGSYRLGFLSNPDQALLATFNKYIIDVLDEDILIYVHDMGKSKETTIQTLSKIEDFCSFIGIPLYAREKHIGFLNLFTRIPYKPTNAELEFLKLVGTHAVLAIDSTLMMSDLQTSNLELVKAYDSTLLGWSHAMDLRDRETEGHTLRVTEMCEKLARQMRIPEADLVHLRRGALLHDIGKIAVPDSILLKSGKLTSKEREIMCHHPRYAHDFLIAVDYLKPAIDIPACHHERWDGSGYPNQLAGEAIPLFARIFSVVDVWDALISDRPYRKAWPKSKARKYIQGQSGKQFDPIVVKEFIKMIG